MRSVMPLAGQCSATRLRPWLFLPQKMQFVDPSISKPLIFWAREGSFSASQTEIDLAKHSGQTGLVIASLQTVHLPMIEGLSLVGFISAVYGIYSIYTFCELENLLNSVIFF